MAAEYPLLTDGHITSSSPILFRLSPHRLARRVLHLEPIRRAARAKGRVLPLAHDAFQPHPAGVVEDGLAVIEFQMLVVPDPQAGLGQGRRKRGTHHQRIAPRLDRCPDGCSLTRAPSLRAMTRNPSCLISCSHSAPEGGFGAFTGRYGGMNPAGSI